MSDLSKTPPHDRLAEQAVIGAVLLAPKLYGDLELKPEEFYLPAHELIWGEIGRLQRDGKPTDPVSVQAHLDVTGQLRLSGGAPYLHDCVSVASAGPGAAFHHAEIIHERAATRRLIAALDRAAAIAEGEDSTERKLELIESELGRVPARDSGDVDSLMTLDQFIERDLGEEEWVIPGLLAREERLILTAGEGVGKSTLMRQFAACAAAGVHPFTGQFHDRRKVLYIDIENPERIMQRRMREIRTAVRAHGANPGDRLWMERRPGGINLCSPADRRWLARRMDAVWPDLLVVGPVYKLAMGESFRTDEELAAAVTSVLDEFRGRYGCAMVLEAHAPKATEGGRRKLEPIGSSLWMRWPEFGIGLSPADHPAAAMRRMVDVVHWRGARDERHFPTRLESGGESLPWVECVL